MRAGVEFVHRGRRHVLRFGANQMVAAEEASGRKTLELVQELQDGEASLRTFRTLFWAGLGTVTQQEAGDMIDDLGMAEAAQIIGKALMLAFPAAEVGEDAPGNEGAATA